MNNDRFFAPREGDTSNRVVPKVQGPERQMHEDDWKALYLVMQLFAQVCLHGRRALLPFAQAVVEQEGNP